MTYLQRNKYSKTDTSSGLPSSTQKTCWTEFLLRDKWKIKKFKLLLLPLEHGQIKISICSMTVSQVCPSSSATFQKYCLLTLQQKNVFFFPPPFYSLLKQAQCLFKTTDVVQSLLTYIREAITWKTSLVLLWEFSSSNSITPWLRFWNKICEFDYDYHPYLAFKEADTSALYQGSE